MCQINVSWSKLNLLVTLNFEHKGGHSSGNGHSFKGSDIVEFRAVHPQSKENKHVQTWRHENEWGKAKGCHEGEGKEG